jgi:hypothetical protein
VNLRQPAAPTGREAAPSLRLDPRSLAAVALLAWLYLMILASVPLYARLAGVGAIVGTVLFLSSPRIEHAVVVLPLFFALGFREFTLSPFMPTVATLAGFAATCLWISEKIVWNRSLSFLDHPGLRLALLGLLLQLATIFISIDVLGLRFWNAVRDGSALFLFLPTAMIVAETCRDERRLQALMRSLILTLLIVGSIGVFQYFTSSGVSRVDVNFGYSFRTRIGSTLSTANVLAGYLELMTPIALALLFAEKSRCWRLVSLAAFVTGFLSVLFTFSRGGFFMTTGAVSLVLVYQFRRKPLVPIIAGLGFVFVMAGNADTFARQLSLVTDPQDVTFQPTLVHRAVTYRSFWHEFTEHPLTGIGWGSEEFYWGHTILYSFWDVRHWVGRADIAHFGGLNSVFLNSALKGGVLSIAALMMILACAIVSSARALAGRGGVVAAGVVAGLAGLAGHQLADNLIRWPQINAFLWMQIGILCAMSRPQRRSSDSSASDHVINVLSGEAVGNPVTESSRGAD